MKTRSKKIKTVIIAVFFLAFWITVLWLCQRMLVPKYQTGVVEGSMVEEYYKDKTKHDVIMVGDCEVYETFSTAELWKKYGITSYIRGSAQQLTWQSYYLVEDTLRRETPKVVVYNVYSLMHDEPQSEAYNRMTLDGMEWSKTKYDAVKASKTKDEDTLDYVFPLLRFHSRWSKLEDDDFRHMFSKDKVTHNGYYLRADVRPEGDFPDPMPLADYTLSKNAMDYLERMRKLCEDKGVKLVLVKAPIVYPHWYDQWDEQVSEYAKKNGLDYINFIKQRDEIGLDMNNDTYDAGLHLNVFGAEKMSDHFGKWLVENCGLADHRSDGELSQYYSKLVEDYENEKKSQLEEIKENGKLISHIPAEEKETNVLRNFIILAVTAALCLTLVACGSDESKAADSTAASSSASADSSKGESSKNDEPKKSDGGFKLTMKGTAIAINDDMAPIAEKLGKPTKYFESESCAYQGLDKVYTYGGVVIRTYPKEKNDFVLNVELKDDSVSTEEGISIGDAKDKVKEVYGEPTSTTDTSSVYKKGDSNLTFIFGSDGSVSSIVYGSLE